MTLNGIRVLAGLLALACLALATTEGRTDNAPVAGSIAANEETFEAIVLQAGLPVLVDFWAPWSGPNKQIAPIIEKIAAAYADKLVVAKVDIDESPGIATKYALTAIPTLIIFRDGAVVASHVGLMNEADLFAWVRQNAGLP